MVQGLRLHTCTAWVTDSILDLGTQVLNAVLYSPKKKEEEERKKINLSSKHWNFAKLLPTTVTSTNFKCIKIFLSRWTVTKTILFLKILYNNTCQHLEELCDLVTQYFPNDPCMMLQNHVWRKEPFKVQDGPINFELQRKKPY